MTVRCRVLVAGRVQGVFFRDTCRSEAQRAGVSGWVRNRRDGRVEAVFEGDEESVEHLVAWCGHGPPGAGVEQVEVSDDEPTGDSGFSIR